MSRLRILSACLLASSMLSSPAFAESDAEIKELKAQLKAMSQRLEALEAQKTAAPNSSGYVDLSKPAPPVAKGDGKPMAHASISTSPQLTSGAKKTVAGEGEPVVGGSMPGSFKLPGTNTSVKFGGYAKLDAIEDVGTGYGAQFANFAAIPLKGSVQANRDAQFNMHARQSRLNMETRTPTDMGELKTFLEVDFFGSARGNANTTNGEGLQLRQAYGQVGHVLAGQTWSNFMDLDAYPESLDYIGPAGLTFVRQAQVRYTDTFADNYTWSLAIESPQTDTATVTNRASLNEVPDLTGKLIYKDTFGQVAVRGLARQLDAGDTVTGAEGKAFGWGLGVSGKLLAFEKDSILFQGVYGDGVGHYLFDVANSGNGNTLVGDDLEPQTAWGGYVGYQHYWSDAWRSNFLAGYTGIDNDVARTGTAVNKEIASGHVNLIWSPAPTYRVGVEYMHGYRELENGTEGDLDRIQTSFMYLF
jgi:hypothetical protein